jgi:hypothetical protein
MSVNVPQINTKSRNTPVLWGALYLILIPLFAVFYYLLPNGFQHNTIKYEAYLEQDKQKILKNLKEAIVTNFEKKYGAKNAIVDGYHINTEYFYIYNLEVEDRRYSFYLLAHLEKNNDDYSELFKLSFFIGDNLTLPDSITQVFPLYAVEKQSSELKVQNLFPLIYESNRFFYPPSQNRLPNLPEQIKNKEYGYLSISTEFEKELIAYSDALRGFPSKSSGSFMRMLYLSAITITTVGFGDIVPITDLARGLVATEAVLGIVIIGFFLNAVASKIKK